MTVQAIFIGLMTPVRLLIGTVRTLAAALGALAGGDFTLALKVLGRGLAQTLAPSNAAEALGFGDLDKDREPGLRKELRGRWRRGTGSGRRRRNNGRGKR